MHVRPLTAVHNFSIDGLMIDVPAYVLALFAGITSWLANLIIRFVGFKVGWMLHGWMAAGFEM
jgi:hypothetical protein